MIIIILNEIIMNNFVTVTITISIKIIIPVTMTDKGIMIVEPTIIIATIELIK